MNIEIIKTILNAEMVDLFDICRYSDVSGYLQNNAASRRVPAGAATVLMAAFPYNTGAKPENISRYSAVPDYHDVCMRILKKCAAAISVERPDSHTACFIDNSPLPEVYTAAFCGLGAVGDNGLLITKKYGSYVFLGEIITDVVFEGIEYKHEKIRECLKCGACASHCPGGAIGDSGFNRKMCLSDITQKKGELEADEKTLIARYGTVWGCDICQDVCPMNRGVQATKIKEFINGFRPRYIPGEDIVGRAYEWRGEKVIMRNAEIIAASRPRKNRE